MQRVCHEFNARLQNCLAEKRLLPTHRNYTRFIIVAGARSGTNMLAHALLAHPQVVPFREIFHGHPQNIEFGVPGFQHLKRNKRVVEMRNNDPVGFINRYIFRSYPKQVRAVGFKLMYKQACSGNQADLRAFLKKDKSIRVIHLKRRDYLAKVLSAQLAHVRKTWTHSVATNAKNVPPEPDQFELPFEFCQERFEQIAQLAEHHEEFFSDHPVLEIYYEDLSDDFTGVMGQVESFLGVDSLPLSARTKKLAVKNPSEILTNYNELKERFKGTRWESFFAQ